MPVEPVVEPFVEPVVLFVFVVLLFVGIVEELVVVFTTFVGMI